MRTNVVNGTEKSWEKRSMSTTKRSNTNMRRFIFKRLTGSLGCSTPFALRWFTRRFRRGFRRLTIHLESFHSQSENSEWTHHIARSQRRRMIGSENSKWKLSKIKPVWDMMEVFLFRVFSHTEEYSEGLVEWSNSVCKKVSIREQIKLTGTRVVLIFELFIPVIQIDWIIWGIDRKRLPWLIVVVLPFRRCRCWGRRRRRRVSIRITDCVNDRRFLQGVGHGEIIERSEVMSALLHKRDNYEPYEYLPYSPRPWFLDENWSLILLNGRPFQYLGRFKYPLPFDSSPTFFVAVFDEFNGNSACSPIVPQDQKGSNVLRLSRGRKSKGEKGERDWSELTNMWVRA